MGYPLVSRKDLVSGLSEEASSQVDLKQKIHPIGPFGSFSPSLPCGVATAKRLNTFPMGGQGD